MPSLRLSLADANPAEHSADVVCHGHQASADRSETVPVQYVENHGPQECKVPYTVAMGVVVSVLIEVGVGRLMPLVLDRAA